MLVVHLDTVLVFERLDKSSQKGGSFAAHSEQFAKEKETGINFISH
jgi:hypothetical protein